MSNLSTSSGSELAWRLKAIGDVEQKIAELIKHAQTCINELSKEKQASIVYAYSTFNGTSHLFLLKCEMVLKFSSSSLS